MLVLGVETSCDETAAAVVRDGEQVLSNVVWSQQAAHARHGGVVPELAARAHLEHLPVVIQEALRMAGTDWDDLDRLAVTRGPGLAGALLVGLTAVKALALRTGKPFWGVNHLQAHLYACFLGSGTLRPDETRRLLALLVSGGHTCLALMQGVNRFHLAGRTLDDAAGEALDKGAGLLGLGYPGGPALEKAARDGNPGARRFPVGRIRRHAPTGGLEPSYCFSYSGVKTALRLEVERRPPPDPSRVADLAAGYQQAVLEALIERTARAADRLQPEGLVCGGGVVQNAVFREALGRMAAERSLPLRLAEPAYCGDNAAMIAALAGCPDYRAPAAGMDTDVSPRLSLETA